MRGINLLTENDLKALRRAMRERREMTLDREWAPTEARLRVSIVDADPLWAPAVMLGRVELWRGNMSSSQYCGSYSELLWLLEGVTVA